MKVVFWYAEERSILIKFIATINSLRISISFWYNEESSIIIKVIEKIVKDVDFFVVRWRTIDINQTDCDNSSGINLLIKLNVFYLTLKNFCGNKFD